MHVGFFMTPTYYDDFRPTWHPQKCAGTFAKSSCHDPQAKPDKINRWSFLPSTLVSKHRPKIFDTHNGVACRPATQTRRWTRGSSSISRSDSKIRSATSPLKTDI